MKNYIKISLFLFFSSLFPFTASADTNEPLAWSYQYAIATAEDDIKRRPVLGILNEQAEFLKPELADTVAELLITHVNDPGTIDDTLHWYGKILANTEDPRYRDILKEVIFTTNSAAVEERANGYLKKLRRDDTAAQYKKGDIDIGALRQQYILNSENAWPKNKSLKVSDLKKRDSIGDIFDAFGPPQHINTGGATTFAIPKLYLYYRGIGRFEFKYQKRRRLWRLMGIVDEPLAFEFELPHHKYSTDKSSKTHTALLMSMLLDDGIYTAREAVKQQALASDPSEEFLDTAAEILIRGFSAKNSRAKLDFYAWICRLLAEQGGTRYIEILKTVATESKNTKLREYATKPIKPDSPKTISTTPYQVGSIKLEEKKLAYPSPYL
ncbi:hypothetical protein [Aurantivibrio infirmus]